MSSQTLDGLGEEPILVSGFVFKCDGSLEPVLDEDGHIRHTDKTLELDRLCSLCGVIAREALLPPAERSTDTRLLFYDSEARLRKSVLDGCHLCGLFWAERIFERVEGIPESEPGPSNPDHPRSWVTVNDEDPLCLRYHHINDPEADKKLIVARRADRHESGDGRLVVINEFEQLTRDVEPQISATLSSVSNASAATFGLASTWLNRCLSKHPKCRELQSSSAQAPTRLIHVGDEAQSMVRLNYPKESVPYVALSHCWGTSETLRLTQANHDAMLEGLNDSDLPRLYRDAVLVTRRLGIQYIWIDSLCIIQDSIFDWDHESNHMGNIYQGAFFTLAANSASDSSTSLFTRIMPQCTEPCIVPGALGAADDGIVIGRLEGVQWPLHTRAWVMQERLLPARTLHYTNRGIQWNCIEASHAGPGYDEALHRGQSVFGNVTRNWNNLLDIAVADLTEDTKMKGQYNWMCIVAAYGSSLLTFPKDRPHALKGIISVLAQRTGLELVAGACVDFLPYSILWACAGPADKKDWDTAVQSCPSWSCTFQPGKFWHRGPFETHTIDPDRRREEVDAEIDKETLRLRLKGKRYGPVMVEAVPGVQPDANGYLPSQNAIRGVDSDGSVIPYHHLCSGPHSMNVVEPLFDFIPTERIEVDFVLVVTDSVRLSDSSKTRVGFGLILRRVDGETADEMELWERVGFFVTREFDDFGVSEARTSFKEGKEYIVR